MTMAESILRAVSPIYPEEDLGERQSETEMLISSSTEPEVVAAIDYFAETFNESKVKDARIWHRIGPICRIVGLAAKRLQSSAIEQKVLGLLRRRTCVEFTLQVIGYMRLECCFSMIRSLALEGGVSLDLAAFTLANVASSAELEGVRAELEGCELRDAERRFLEAVLIELDGVRFDELKGPVVPFDL